MKRHYLPLIGALLLAGAAHAADVRKINGVAVNLDPVHAWIASPEGDRPMPHWKRATLLESRGQANGCHVVVVRFEGDKGPREVLVQYLPADTVKLLNEQRALAAALGRATLFAAVASADLTSTSGLSTGGVVSGSAGYVDATVKEWQRNRNIQAAAAARAEMAEAQRQQLQARLTVVDRTLAEKYDLLLDSRRVVGGRQLWIRGI